MHRVRAGERQEEEKLAFLQGESMPAEVLQRRAQARWDSPSRPALSPLPSPLELLVYLCQRLAFCFRDK